MLALLGAEVVLLPHAVRKMHDPDGGLSFDGEGIAMPESAILAAQRQMIEPPSPKFHDVQNEWRLRILCRPGRLR